jgi:rhodanese-related sulfurtransferase
MRKTTVLLSLLVASLFAVACGSSSEQATGIRVVSPTDASSLQSDPPDGLVVLDVRTPEEFADGHIEGATMIDFYSPNFRDQLAELDPDQPYLIYCRSGNRSGQTRAILEELDFADVADVDGGIVAWQAEGLPVVLDG